MMKLPRSFSALLKILHRREEGELRAANQRLEKELTNLRAVQSHIMRQSRFGQITSGTVRDFNNALTPILGFSELLLTNEAVWRSPAQARRFLEMLHGSARDVAKLVGRLSELHQSAEPSADSITVPASPEKIEPAADADGRLSILVVDDDERVCEVVAEYLVGDGHEVTIATSGNEALAQVEGETFDVVFLDRAMPQMSGDEAAELIKRSRPQLPIIMLTGFGAFIEVTGAVDGVLGKPVTRSVLRQTLAKFRRAA